MATPDFVLALRDRIGHMPLWLSGVTAVVLRDDEVLLVKRSDNGAWTPVTGIIDPGEQPAVAARREVLEEAAVEVEVQRLASVNVTAPMVYPNGDEAQYLDLTFLCRWVSGEPFPEDGENTEAAWFSRDALPPMAEVISDRIASALDAGPGTRFER